MKRYIKSAQSTVDLSDEKKIGLELIRELRKLYPQIPVNPKCKRSHAWVNCWYLMFNLGPLSDYGTNWSELHEFEARCSQIAKSSKYTNDFIQSAINLYTSTDNAYLEVFAITKPYVAPHGTTRGASSKVHGEKRQLRNIVDAIYDEVERRGIVDYFANIKSAGSGYMIDYFRLKHGYMTHEEADTIADQMQKVIQDLGYEYNATVHVYKGGPDAFCDYPNASIVIRVD